jgi:competence protein ComGC
MRTRLKYPPSRSQAGFYIVGMLIVIVIIFVLMRQGPLATDPVSQVSNAQINIEKSSVAACAVNRNSITADFTQWQIVNFGQTPSMEILRRKINIPTCSSGGVYTIGSDGAIHCTVHAPPPLEDLQKQVSGNNLYQ